MPDPVDDGQPETTAPSTTAAKARVIAAASGLVIRKAAKTPVVIFRGLEWTPDQHASASDILRTPEKDMFR